MRIATLATALSLTCTTLSAAQSAAPPESIQDPLKQPRDYAGLKLDFTLDAYFPRLVGNVTSPAGVERDVKELDLANSEVTFAGNGRISWDRWFVGVDGFTFETDSEFTEAGQSHTASFDWWGVAAEVGYELWTPFADQSTPWGTATYDRYGGNVNSNGDYTLDLRLAPTLGLAYQDVEFNDLNVLLGTSQGSNGTWMAPMIGADLQVWLRPGDDFPFLKAVVIEFSISGGPTFGVSGDADGTGYLVTLEGGGRLMILDNVGVHLGYRLVDADFKGSSGSDDMNVGLQGLIAGIAIRF